MKKELTTLNDFLDKQIGEKGTKARSEHERGLETFKLGVILHQARLNKGLTQEELAGLAGTNKSYISKLERDLKDVRWSTLQRIIEDGLGGKLQVSIQF